MKRAMMDKRQPCWNCRRPWNPMARMHAMYQHSGQVTMHTFDSSARIKHMTETSPAGRPTEHRCIAAALLGPANTHIAPLSKQIGDAGNTAPKIQSLLTQIWHAASNLYKQQHEQLGHKTACTVARNTQTANWRTPASNLHSCAGRKQTY